MGCIRRGLTGSHAHYFPENRTFSPAPPSTRTAGSSQSSRTPFPPPSTARLGERESRKGRAAGTEERGHPRGHPGTPPGHPPGPPPHRAAPRRQGGTSPGAPAPLIGQSRGRSGQWDGAAGRPLPRGSEDTVWGGGARPRSLRPSPPIRAQYRPVSPPAGLLPESLEPWNAAEPGLQSSVILRGRLLGCWKRNSAFSSVRLPWSHFFFLFFFFGADWNHLFSVLWQINWTFLWLRGLLTFEAGFVYMPSPRWTQFNFLGFKWTFMFPESQWKKHLFWW